MFDEKLHEKDHTWILFIRFNEEYLIDVRIAYKFNNETVYIWIFITVLYP